ncbi:MAG: S8 family serine peptidase, partial [Gammaproteobacteria bacterium]|nr:S8 family serine peptidase [Gammaproteobacteria bacterium]
MDRYFTPRYALAAFLGLATLVSYAGVREVSDGRVRLDSAGKAAGKERLYIVQMDEPPALALFDAGIRSGLRASGLDKRRIERFDPTSPRVNRYVSHLKSRQSEILRTVRAEHRKVYSYRYTFNGVAVKLTPREANKLRLRKGVNKVWADRRRKVTTNYSPSFLGLFDTDGGLRSDLGLRGEDVIIGVIDSGIAPGHPSFSHREQIDRRTPKLCRGSFGDTILGFFLCRKYRRPLPVVYGASPADWNGICQPGRGFDANDCNNKLIGARFYREGFDLLGDPIDENEFNSPADADGHGTHVASIAAGNLVNSSVFGRKTGRISGIAPRARVAVYKACWLPDGATRASCSIADAQKAIEDAVADGVDIINYAIGSVDNSLTDPDDLALLAAADAGILAVTPTGNDGPSPGSIDSPATTPWVISVGASSRAGNRTAEGLRVNKPEAVAGDYESKEAAFTPKLADTGPVTGNLVLADDGEIITPEGEVGTVFDACDALINSDDINNNIAFVQRGGCDFDLKLQNVQDAGAVAMVVFNNDAGVLLMSGDLTVATVPAAMIGQADGQLLRDRINSEDIVEITLDKDIFITFAEVGDVMGSFSGRGPSFGDPDFL